MDGRYVQAGEQDAAFAVMTLGKTPHLGRTFSYLTDIEVSEPLGLVGRGCQGAFRQQDRPGREFHLGEFGAAAGPGSFHQRVFLPVADPVVKIAVTGSHGTAALVGGIPDFTPGRFTGEGRNFLGRTPDNGFRAEDVQHVLAVGYPVAGPPGNSGLAPFDAPTPGVAAVELREKLLVRFDVIGHVKTDLFQIGQTGSGARLFLGMVQRGQKHSRQDRDDRDDYEELYQGEKRSLLM